MAHWTDKVNPLPTFQQELHKYVKDTTFGLTYAYFIRFLVSKPETKRRWMRRFWKLRKLERFRTLGNFRAFIMKDEWFQKNVRNQLCLMVHQGTLERIERGVYRFVKETK